MSAVNQGWLVARREMRERSRSRGFRISLLLMVLLAVAMVMLPGLLDTSDSTRQVGISGTASDILEETLSAPGRSGDLTVQVRRFDTLAAGEKALRGEKVDVLVVSGRRLEWRGREDAELQALVTNAIRVATVRERADTEGMDQTVLARMLAPIPVESVQIGAVAGRSADDDAAAALMTVALLAAIIIYGNLVLTGVVEEKSSRVVEVLLARIPARALLGGKVVGIGLLGFGQLAVTALAALIASAAGQSLDLPAVTGGVLAWVLVWFVLGYALYAMIYGALGSLASRTEDAQAAAGPVSYVLVAGYWASFIAINADPDGLWSRVLSLFPATAPLAMPARIALGVTKWWESPLAVVLTLAAIIGLVRFAGRVYQNAILRTGAKMTLRDAWHASVTAEARQSSTRDIRKFAAMLTTQHRPAVWTIALVILGVLTATWLFLLTEEAMWSIATLLLTMAAVRRVLQHR